jgi:hypothetical protein
VLPAEQKLLFLLNLLVTDRSIAEIVSKPEEATTDKFRSLQGLVFNTNPFLFGQNFYIKPKRVIRKGAAFI